MEVATHAVQPSIVLSMLSITVADNSIHAADWLRFRGPNGSGISTDEQPTPVTWSPSENLRWKTALPGAGVSCPIVVGDRVFVTCYSGYGMDRGNAGNQEDLKRHLVCVDRSTGKTLWQKTIDPLLPEDPFAGAGVPEHGYASHTPASDGQNIYVFFGKSGVYAFDQFEQLAVNRLTEDPEDFSATPAVSNGELFFRSNRHLYCVSDKK